MTPEEFASVINRKFNELAELNTKHSTELLLSGRVSSFDTYRFHAGQLEGHRQAKEALAEAIKRAMAQVGSQ